MLQVAIKIVDKTQLNASSLQKVDILINCESVWVNYNAQLCYDYYRVLSDAAGSTNNEDAGPS